MSKKPERENSIGYQISYTENLYRNNLNRQFSKADLDITPEQFFILVLLDEQSEGISMQHISEQIHRDNSAITRTIDSLEKKNCVIRSSTKEDRRKKLIVITNEGKKHLKKAKNIARQHVKDSVKGLSEKQLSELFKNLKTIQDNLINIRSFF